MWMSDPTPETTSNINRLRSSSTNPIGTWRVPRMSSQVKSGVEMSILMKTKQLQTKLPSTARIDIAALIVFDRPANRVMTAADISGRSKISHGSELLVVKFKISKHWFYPRMTRMDTNV